MSRHRRKPPKPLPPAPPVSDVERAEFLNAVVDVKPLKPVVNLPITTAKPLPYPRQKQLDEQEVTANLLLDSYDPSEWETGEELLFKREGVQNGVFSKLRRGQFSVGAELDLHGMIVSVAHEEVSLFLRECLYRHVRCVRIIHGKGYGSKQKLPVLKAKLNKWLQQRDEVLAFCSARQIDGGTGAVYVLLKQR